MKQKLYIHFICFALSIGLLGCTTKATIDTTTSKEDNKSILTNEQGDTMMNEKANIVLLINQDVVTMEIFDNPTGNDFLSILPATLTIENFGTNEKIADLPKVLTLQDAPNGYKPNLGDVTIYGPWGNMAIFIDDGNYANGLVSIGKVISGLEILQQITPGTIITIQKI